MQDSCKREGERGRGEGEWRGEGRIFSIYNVYTFAPPFLCRALIGPYCAVRALSQPIIQSVLLIVSVSLGCRGLTYASTRKEGGLTWLERRPSLAQGKRDLAREGLPVQEGGPEESQWGPGGARAGVAARREGGSGAGS